MKNDSADQKHALAAFLLALVALVHLLLTVYAVFQVMPRQQEVIAVFDPARQVGQLATLATHERETRDAALKEALRALFGWGQYADQSQDILTRFQDAYWLKVRVTPEARALEGQSLTVTDLVWGRNYVKVSLAESPRLLQLNFWDIQQDVGRPENPTGWRFSARVGLIEEGGIGL